MTEELFEAASYKKEGDALGFHRLDSFKAVGALWGRVANMPGARSTKWLMVKPCLMHRLL